MKKKILLAASAFALTAGVSMYSLSGVEQRTLAKVQTEQCPPECCEGTGTECGPDHCAQNAKECCEQ